MVPNWLLTLLWFECITNGTLSNDGFLYLSIHQWPVEVWLCVDDLPFLNDYCISIVLHLVSDWLILADHSIILERKTIMYVSSSCMTIELLLHFRGEVFLVLDQPVKIVFIKACRSES